MRCACCQREIKSLYSYTYLMVGKIESFVANFCGSCWSSLVDAKTNRQLQGFAGRIMKPQVAGDEVLGQVTLDMP